jgi:cytochrome c-type biogenesis protein CcmH/NrfF
LRIAVPLIVLSLLAGAIVLVMRARRRRAQVSELNQHPERLEQMLDESDDA